MRILTGLLNLNTPKEPAPVVVTDDPKDPVQAAADFRAAVDLPNPRDLGRAGVDAYKAANWVVIDDGPSPLPERLVAPELMALVDKLDRPNVPDIRGAFVQALRDGLDPDDYVARLRAAQDDLTAFGTILPPDASEPLQVQATEDQPIDRLALGKSVTKALIRAGFETVGDLRAYEGDWTDFAGIGAKGAESIAEAVARYVTAPGEASSDADADAPVITASVELERIEVHQFDALLIVDARLELHGLGGWRIVDARQVFEGADPYAVAAALRTFADCKRLVLSVPDDADLWATITEWADQYGVPALRAKSAYM